MLQAWALIFLSLTSVPAWSYSDFIGYGYSTCVTCHYNGSGGGPLNDYGRGVWSAEIASRALYPKSISDEALGTQSGFLGPVELPYWIRPHAKYRGIEVRTNPKSVDTDQAKFYQMQTDFGLAVQDKTSKYVAVGTWGRLVPPDEFASGRAGLDHIRAREYYARVQVAKTWWVYAGLMTKVYGIRNIDHTSYQRQYQGFDVQNNTPDGIAESEGVVVQKIEENWETTINAFFGNPYDKGIYQQKGISSMSEFTIDENKRLGFSLMTEQSHVKRKNLGAVHYRQGLSRGSDLLFEWGLLQDRTPIGDSTTGSYGLLQAMVLLTRGYSFKSTIEMYNQEFKASSPQRWRWSGGLFMFPAPRLELRLEAINSRSFSDQLASGDGWTLEGQVHVSL